MTEETLFTRLTKDGVQGGFRKFSISFQLFS